MVGAVGDREWKMDQAGDGAERADVDDGSVKEEYSLYQRTRV